MSKSTPIHFHGDAPAVEIPDGYTGPVTLPGNGRTIWWTGRVAIGLRHQAQTFSETTSQSALWIQGLLLAARRRGRATA
jgi:hypothetical protein